VSYRTKLLLTFLIVAIVTNGISLTLMYRLSRTNLFEGYQDKIQAIAASTGAMLDGDLLKTIQGPADEELPAYAHLDAILRRALAANVNDETKLKRLFTVMPAREDRSVLLVGVDPMEGLHHVRAGEVYRAVGAPAIDVSKPQVEDRFVTDEFGTSLRAYAPVRDSSGQVVGAVIVQSASTWVESKLRPAMFSVFAALSLAALLSLPAAFFISARASRPLTEISQAVDSIGKGIFDTRVEVRSNDDFGHVAAALNQMAVGLGERDRVKSAFARYVSHQVMDSVLKSGKSVQLSGDRRRISVLFCDIRGFSTISERMAPEKVVELLNEYFDRMVEVVFRNQGTLDKFIGAGMMVIFGAPEDDPYQEEHALKTGLEMQREVAELAAKWEPEGVRLRIGVGINSGPAIVGNIGSSRRMEYTAIGDTVNLASRLESATKDLGVGILVSEYTYIALRGAFKFRSMGSVHVKGRVEPVLTYAVEDDTPAVDQIPSAKEPLLAANEHE
jgi:adenylate cyclase